MYVYIFSFKLNGFGSVLCIVCAKIQLSESLSGRRKWFGNISILDGGGDDCNKVTHLLKCYIFTQLFSLYA